MNAEKKPDSSATLSLGGNSAAAKAAPPTRWIAYLSQDRRVLWSECQGGFPAPPAQRNTPPYRDALPGGQSLRHVVDAAFVTRQPQYASRRVVVDGREEELVFKAFPDFGVNGKVKGVVQIVEKVEDGAGAACVHPGQDQAFLDYAQNGMAVYDPVADRLLAANRRLAQETGYSVEDLKNMPGKTLFGVDGARLLRGIHSRIVTAGESMVWGQMLELRDRGGVRETYFALLRLDGPRRHDGRPQPLRVSLSQMDLNRLTGLPHDGHTPRFALEALKDGLWEYDVAARTYHYSACFRDIFGPEGIPGGPGKALDDWADAVYRGEPGKLFHGWRQLVKNGVRYSMQYRIRDVEGRWRWIMASIHAVLNDADGRPAKILGFHADITHAMLIDRNLVEMEERFRVVFENSGLGIALCRRDGSVERVNPAFAVLLGRDREEFEDRMLHEFADPSGGKEMQATLLRIQRGGRRETMTEIRFPRRDGREVWVNITATLSREISDGARYLIVMLEDVTAGREKREKLQYEATHDVMTGAWTRWVLLERLGQHIGLSHRYNAPMTFCICDLDHFKRVNDLYGHQAGDQVLVRFVEIIKESVRETDVVGRYGGEEFGIVFPNTPMEGAMKSLKRALERLRRERFDDSLGDGFGVTATFGVSCAMPGCDIKQVVEWADNALYEGKEAGRNRVVAHAECFRYCTSCPV